MRRMGLGWTALLLVAGLLLWAPWLTPERAAARAESVFAARWAGVIDGCGLDCRGCGARGARRTLLGWQVELEYACGMLPSDSPEYHERGTAFVSVFWTVHGLGR